MQRSRPQSSGHAPKQKNQIRIIGGEWKRRQLKFPNAEGLRPTPDRVRETVFNWLGQDLWGKTCLDLFAGSGGLGFEAASRRARKVIMIEANHSVSKTLQENRQTLGASNIEVLCMDGMIFLDKNKETFDVVFLDPPFHSDLLGKALAKLAPHLAETAYVYVETDKWPTLSGWRIVKKGKAGMVHYGLISRDTPNEDVEVHDGHF